MSESSVHVDLPHHVHNQHYHHQHYHHSSNRSQIDYNHLPSHSRNNSLHTSIAPDQSSNNANHRQQNQVYPQQQQQQQQQPQPQPQKPQQHQEKDRISVMAIPSMEVVGNQLNIGDAQSVSERSYTFVKAVGDGSFGQVWLCDWHSHLPPHVTLARMQQGQGARAEWHGKHLVAIKRMKKRWEGGWDECKKHPELESLRSIPPHENVIPLYDCFILPSTKELYFVFECMEGNLYQLIKSRKGRPIAGGLVSSIFRQVTSGLAHIHNSGYFHRDMKPENLLVTTTGVTDYLTVSPIAPPGAPPEKDVMVLVKLADFGLAREIQSKPPYTEYVSTRWYRAPEVLLRSTDYSSPVDLWALGTIIAELVNLKPLFPGINEYDQVRKICEVLGDPSDYGFDSQGRPRGGGKWPRGLKIAKQNGLVYEKTQPLDFYSLFDVSVPRSLIDCIAALLRYEPEARLTARDCLEHQYFIETTPRFSYPTSLQIPSSFPGSASSSKSSKLNQLSTLSPRSLPPSHAHSPAYIKPPFNHANNGTSHYPHRQPFYPPQQNGDVEMISVETASVFNRNAHHHHQDSLSGDRMVLDPPAQQENNANQKSGILGFGKKWGLGSVFGHNEKPTIQIQNSLPPVEEITFASRSTPSLQRTPSSSSESRSLPDMSPSVPVMPSYVPPVPPLPPIDPKKLEKEQKRLAKEAETEKRAAQQKLLRERSQAVVRKRQLIQQQGAVRSEIEFQSVHSAILAQPGGLERRTKPKTSGTQKDPPSKFNVPPGVAAASSYGGSAYGRREGNQTRTTPSTGAMPLLSPSDNNPYGHDPRYKRPRDDDDHSLSSQSDVHSAGRMSVISFATVDSDPGPGRSVRKRGSTYGFSTGRGIATTSSMSSLQSYTTSPRTSHSVEPPVPALPTSSIDPQFVSDFANQNFGDPTVSPFSMQYQTLAGSPSMPAWTIDQGPSSGPGPSRSSGGLAARRLQAQPYIAVPSVPVSQASGHSPHSECTYTTTRSHPPTPHSAVAPLFSPPPPLPSTSHTSTTTQSLPPFASFIHVAEQHHPPQPLDPTRHPPDPPP